MDVPFNRPTRVEGELEAIRAALDSGALAGNGFYTRLSESWLQQYFQTAAALLTPSCTHALELAALVLGIGPGDEVIMPSWTFVSTANAFVLRGAVPVFVDICAETGCLDTELIEAAITEKTRAIVPVHYAGGSCDMDALMGLARRYNLWVIEDAAQSLMSFWRGRPLGGIGHLGALSFHATKNLTSGGEGGALLVNDPALVERAEVLREKGTDRTRYLRGELHRYQWQDVGSSYLPGELQAAALSAQLQQAQTITARRCELWQGYQQAFGELEDFLGIQFLKVRPECAHNGHIYALRLPSENMFHELQGHLAQEGVQAQSHYMPLHDSPAGKRYGRIAGSLMETNRLTKTLLRLPLFDAMTEQQQDWVIRSVRKLCNPHF